MTGLVRALGGIGIALLLVNVGIQMFDIIGRWVFSMPQVWVSEIYQLTLPVAVACCFPLPLHEGEMITIKYVGQFLGSTADRALSLFGAITMSIFFAGATLQVFFYAVEAARSGRATWMTGIPLAPTWFTVTALLAVSTGVQIMGLVNRPSPAGHNLSQ